MSYALHVTKVVSGVLLAAVAYAFAGSADYFGPLLASGAVLAVGIGLAVHGLFTGIEAAVGRETTVQRESDHGAHSD